MLLEHGADVNTVNNDGWTPLFRIALGYRLLTGEQEDLQTIDLLLAYKAEISVTDKSGHTLMQVALRHPGQTNVVARLRQHGAKE